MNRDWYSSIKSNKYMTWLKLSIDNGNSQSGKPMWHFCSLYLIKLIYVIIYMTKTIWPYLSKSYVQETWQPLETMFNFMKGECIPRHEDAFAIEDRPFKAQPNSHKTSWTKKNLMMSSMLPKLLQVAKISKKCPCSTLSICANIMNYAGFVVESPT
jgi:hypothetical protein